MFWNLHLKPLLYPYDHEGDFLLGRTGGDVEDAILDKKNLY